MYRRALADDSHTGAATAAGVRSAADLLGYVVWRRPNALEAARFPDRKCRSRS
jgi:hypothetical protein